MSAYFRPLCAALTLWCLFAAAGAGAQPTRVASIQGQKAAQGQRAVVLLFIARDCPISNAYAPEIKRIIARYSPQRIAFQLVYPDPDTTLVAAKRHAQEYGYSCPVILDPKHRLVRKAGATVTPEAAVFAPDGKLLYRGRIDDLYVTFGQRRFAATKHNLRDVLEAVVRGRRVATPRTTAIGCFI
jgi:hypothetical protein